MSFTSSKTILKIFGWKESLNKKYWTHSAHIDHSIMIFGTGKGPGKRGLWFHDNRENLNDPTGMIPITISHGWGPWELRDHLRLFHS